MIKQTFKIDYQLKCDEQGRKMLFISSYQNNIKIEEHFVGYINDILTENKKYKEAIDKAIAIINECKLLMPYEYDWEEQIDYIEELLKEVK